MAQVIKIKRSSSTATPTSLNQGELAYSSNSDKLFIGNPGTGDVTVIGGKTYINMLDHAAGTLTANSAIIVDGSSKIDVLNVDNLTLNGNALTSTDTNGDITITPNGTGSIVLDGQNWPQADGTADYYLKTDGSGQLSWAAIPSGTITLSDDQSTPNTDTYTTGETLTFSTGSGLTSTVSDNDIEYKITDGGVNTTQLANDAVTGAKIADNAIDSEHYTDGSIDTAHLANDAVTSAKIADATIVAGNLANSAVQTAKINDGAVTTAKLATAAVQTNKLTDNAVTSAKIAADAITNAKMANNAINTAEIVDSAVTNAKLANSSADIGSTTLTLGSSVSSLTGLTEVASTDFVGDLSKADASGTDTDGADLTIKGGAGTGSGTGGSVLIQVADGASSGSSVNSHATAVTIADDKTMTAAGDVVISGNLTVSGTTTTVNSETVTFDDNILILNNNFSGASPTENGGFEVERGNTLLNAKLLWNETSDKWQVGVGSTMSNLLTASNFETEITSIDGGSF